MQELTTPLPAQQPAALREALLADGCVSDPAVAGRVADDLLAAHRENLPPFS